MGRSALGRKQALDGCFDYWFSLALEEPNVLYAPHSLELEPFVINPRRLLRGSDFLMRWSQGRWSEDLVLQAINSTDEFYAIPYGLSSVAPQGSPQDLEDYFDQLDRAGLGRVKRPDLLVFKREHKERVDALLERCEGLSRLPFTREDDERLRELLELCSLGIECENSLWVARRMPDFGKALKRQRWLNNKDGLPKNAVVPTVILKDEDRTPLKDWQSSHRRKIHIWQVFYDLAYGIALDKAEELIAVGSIAPSMQTFQAPSGPTTTKTIYKVYYHYAYRVSEAIDPPELKADHVEDRNGHILPYVRFLGGRMTLHHEALDTLRKESESLHGLI